MDSPRYGEVKEIVAALLEVDSNSRGARLNELCGDDGYLRHEVESLLQANDEAGNFLTEAAYHGIANYDQKTSSFEARAVEAEPINKGQSMVGRQLGPYQILAPLGSGGMGEVYFARDTKLQRDVAIKVLPSEFANDPERHARFQREARALAALNHPNIAMIHGLEEFDGTSCLVLELVEGETLHGPLPMEKALDYAHQIANAVAAAHHRGIVHRDLKPSNIKVTSDGRVKVLDFGLAKAMWGSDEPQNLSQRAAITDGDTLAGQIVGTPSYMSPEQARSQRVNQRTDIWAFGCLLYELLSGRCAFQGETLTGTISAVLERDPDWTALPPKTPPGVRDLLRRCLQKDVAHRMERISDAEAVLERAQRNPIRWPLITAAALAVAVLAVSTLVVWRLRDVPRPKGVQVRPLTSYPGPEVFPALSPDGRLIAFTWTGLKNSQVDLYVRPVEGDSPVRLTNDAAIECYPAWSPDGSLIAFLHCDGTMGGIRAEAEVYIAASSGVSKRRVGRVLLQAYDNVPSLAWMADGKHLIVRNKDSRHEPVGLFSLNIDTGQARQLTSPKINLDDASPAVSPDGRLLAFVRQTTDRRGDVFIEDLPAGEISGRQITHDNLRILGVAWRSPRELIYLTENGTARTLWRMRSDGSQREPLSAAGKVGLQFSLSRDGRRLAYSDAYIDPDIARVSLSKSQRDWPLPAETIISSTQWDGAPDYSPDGRRIAFASARSGYVEIWLADADGSNPTQLTFWNRNTGTPRWSPAGDEIAADSQEGEHTDIYVIGVNNRHTRKITSSPGRNFIPSWSHDGKSIYFVSDRRDGYQVWKAVAHPLDEALKATQVTKQGGFSGWESFDGKHFYYAKRSEPSCIWMVAADGGKEAEAICPLTAWHYTAMFPDGIYYAPRTSSRIWFFSFADKKTRHVFDLKKGTGGAFAFSPDRKWMLVLAAELRGDLYLIDIENQNQN